ncbi:MAG: transporter [Clostridiaceae bacterium]|nr:transporter [Clostridiaceae bacterium]
MIKKLSLIFQIAAVFIGTIVGAGLASGQEITQFFTTYGFMSFIGIILCCFIYIFIGSMIIKISVRYNLNSYNGLIKIVSPGFLGQITDILTGLFLICGAAIILAGSGALLNEYFHFSKWIGIFLMCLFSIIVLLRNTKGLMEINSFIVPSLIIVVLTIFFLYIFFSKEYISISYLQNIPHPKKNWYFSTLLYGGFNILCCSGVLVPLSSEIKNEKYIIIGTILGAIGLTILSTCINFILLLNMPYILNYQIPLLYISNRFGKLIQIILIAIIWLEMFSTEVSDIFSVTKTLEEKFKISYKKSIFLIMLIAIPISQIGFVNLIHILYPAFGVVSIIFMLQCTVFYYRNFH